MIDGIILFILVGSAWWSYHLGFLKSVYQLLTSVFALILSFVGYPMVTALLKVTPLYTMLIKWSTEKTLSLTESIGIQAQGKLIEEVTDWLPRYVSESIVKNNNPEVYKLLGVDTISEYVATYLANFCLNAIAVVVVWLIVKIILRCVRLSLNVVSRLPIVHQLDKAIGLAFGLLKGVFLIWIIQLILPIVMLAPNLQFLKQLIEQSALYAWFGDINIILQYMNTIFVKGVAAHSVLTRK
jgi:uncharacterized membrane protein required for colicin V production